MGVARDILARLEAGEKVVPVAPASTSAQVKAKSLTARDVLAQLEERDKGTQAAPPATVKRTGNIDLTKRPVVQNAGTAKQQLIRTKTLDDMGITGAEAKRRTAAGEPIVQEPKPPSVLAEFGSELRKSADTFGTKVLEGVRTSVVPSYIAGMSNQRTFISDKDRLDFIKKGRAMTPEQRSAAGITSQDLIDPREELLWREKGYDINQPGREYREGAQTLLDTATETTAKDERFDPNSPIAAAAGEFTGTVLGDLPVYSLQPELGAELSARLGASVAKKAGPMAGQVINYLALNGLNVPVDVVVSQINRALKGGDVTADTLGTDAAIALVARNVLGLLRIKRSAGNAAGDVAESAETGVGVVHDGANISPPDTAQPQPVTVDPPIQNVADPIETTRGAIGADELPTPTIAQAPDKAAQRQQLLAHDAAVKAAEHEHLAAVEAADARLKTVEVTPFGKRPRNAVVAEGETAEFMTQKDADAIRERMVSETREKLEAAKAARQEFHESLTNDTSEARTPYDTPEIIEARKSVAQLRTTYDEAASGARDELHHDIFREMYGTGAAKKRDRELYILLGGPGSGKSTVAQQIADQYGAMMIDNDVIKSKLPEFNGGLGANVVHREASEIVQPFVMGLGFHRGDNMVVQLTGKSYDNIAALVREWADRAGYNVRVGLVELPTEKAVQRSVKRFGETGRFVDPEYILDVGQRPVETYERLKSELPDHVYSFDRYSSDVPFGEPYKQLEHVELVRGQRGSSGGADAAGASDAQAVAQPKAVDPSDQFYDDVERELLAAPYTMSDAELTDIVSKVAAEHGTDGVEPRVFYRAVPAGEDGANAVVTADGIARPFSFTQMSGMPAQSPAWGAEFLPLGYSGPQDEVRSLARIIDTTGSWDAIENFGMSRGVDASGEALNPHPVVLREIHSAELPSTDLLRQAGAPDVSRLSPIPVRQRTYITDAKATAALREAGGVPESFRTDPSFYHIMQREGQALELADDVGSAAHAANQQRMRYFRFVMDAQPDQLPEPARAAAQKAQETIKREMDNVRATAAGNGPYADSASDLVRVFDDGATPPGGAPPSSGAPPSQGNYVETSSSMVESRPAATPEPVDAEAHFRSEIARREAERKAGVPTGMAKAQQALAETKAAVVDYLAPIEDAIYAALKAEGRTVLPSQDIRNAFDGVIMSDHVAGQWARDQGIEEILRSVPDVDIFGEYLLARHAPAIEAAGFDSGRNLVKDAAAVAALRDAYEPAAKKLDVLVRNLLDYRVQSGLKTQEYADYVNELYPEHVPFTRVFSEIEEQPRGGTGGGVGSVSKSAVDKKLTGSKRAAEDPIESLLVKIHDSFRQGEKNKATRTLVSYRDLEDNPLGLEPIRLADNVRERVKIVEDLSVLGREQRKMRRDTASTKGKFVAADKIFQRQLGRINEAMKSTMDESQTIYDAMRVHAADFDPESAIDGLLSRSVSNERRITQIQDRLDAVTAELDELTGEGSRIYEAARTAAGDGASPNEINRLLDRGLRNAQRAHGAAAKVQKLEGKYDQTRAADFRIAQREADEAHTVGMERLESKGLAAERRLYELQGRLEQVDYSKAAEKRNELEQTLSALKLAVAERTENVKAMRSELVRLRDVPKRAGESTISFLNEGVLETWKIKPEMAAALKGLDNERLGLLGKVISAPSRVLKVGTTGVNLAFTAVNTVRDQGTIGVLSSRSAATSLANPKNFTKALFAALKHDELYEEAVREGALFTSYDIARESPKLAVDDLIGPGKAFERARRGGAKTTAKYVITSPARALRVVEDIVSRSEQLGRIQVFNGMRDQLIREGMDPVEARIAARQAALWTTAPFHRSGQWGRVMNSIPYMNANIQGWRQLIGTAMDRPGETSLKAGALFTAIMGAVVWNMAEPDRRKAYEDIDDREKTDYLIIVPPNPTQDARGAWNVMKIPVPQGVNDTLAPLRRTGEWTARKAIAGDPRAMDLAGTILGPEDGGNKTLSMLVPQPVRPSLEVAINKNIYTGRDIISPGLAKKDPDKQVYPWTSGTARIIGKSINTSPVKAEHFIRATAGGAAMQALNASDQVLAATGQIPPEQIGGETPWGALVRRFTKARGGAEERRKRKKK